MIKWGRGCDACSDAPSSILSNLGLKRTKRGRDWPIKCIIKKGLNYHPPPPHEMTKKRLDTFLHSILIFPSKAAKQSKVGLLSTRAF